MAFSVYDVSASIFRRHLTALSGILDKAAQHAEAKKVEPGVLLQARLYPDMFPFVKQVQLGTNFANRGAARLAGVDVPSYTDNETSFDQLKARVGRTLEFLSGLTPQQFEGSEDKDLLIPMGARDPVPYKGGDYLLSFALPNFFFHVTTAYAILRHCGVELGKQDFMGDGA
jgi:hypothetical protein